MGILCWIFGHKVGNGYCDREGEKYLGVRVGAVDGINRVHASLHTDCARCGKRFQVGMIHLPMLDSWVAKLLDKQAFEEELKRKYNARGVDGNPVPL